MTAGQDRLTRLRRAGVGLVCYAGAVVTGLGSAWWVLKMAPWIHNSVQVGVLRADLHAGSQDANMYTRARIALNALLALDQSETMYFIATKGDTGNTLLSRCNYRVTCRLRSVHCSPPHRACRSLRMNQSVPRGKPWRYRVLRVLGTTVLVHVIAVWSAPYLIMKVLMDSPTAQAMHMHNQAAFPPPVDAQVRTSANPKLSSYWSIALYASNSDNFLF